MLMGELGQPAARELPPAGAISPCHPLPNPPPSLRCLFSPFSPPPLLHPPPIRRAGCQPGRSRIPILNPPLQLTRQPAGAITQSVMEDPCMTSSGESYEREALEGCPGAHWGQNGMESAPQRFPDCSEQTAVGFGSGPPATSDRFPDVVWVTGGNGLWNLKTALNNTLSSTRKPSTFRNGAPSHIRLPSAVVGARDQAIA